jgi:hypothetical protein
MTSNENQRTDGHTPDRRDIEPTLLGEVLSLAPRLASRTIAQIQASQQIMSLLSCGGNAAPNPDTDDPVAEGQAMTEPVDVLGVLADQAHDETTDGTAGDPGIPDEDPREAPPGSQDPDPAATASVDVVAEGLESPDVADLVIPGYDSLAASQVVPRLTTLNPDELSAIGAYEAANRGRRTILNRVKQLLASGNGK